MSEPSARRPRLAELGSTALEPGTIESSVTIFDELSRDAGDALLTRRRQAHREVTNNFYDLVTDFYEYGWDHAFHFAPRFRGETFRELLRRHEHYLALKLALAPGDRVLDVGCGIGGPMRAIARFAGVEITGINDHPYQVKRAETLNRAAGLDGTCRLLKADFHHIPLPDASVDKVYAIEATVHAPVLVEVYREIARVLKPGGLFGTFEWCMTDKYQPDNPAHRRVKERVLVGNGLADMGTRAEVEAAMIAAGFEIVSAADLATTGDVPWYEPLSPRRLTPTTFRASPAGRRVTNGVLTVLQALHLVPRGTLSVARMLDEAAGDLVAAGKTGLFTPSFLIVARRR